MEFNDVRFEFISEYTLKSMKMKADKWAKLQGNDEYRQTILDFFEKPEYNIIVIYQNNAGQLQPTFDFPSAMKAKAVYFSKKEKGMNIGKDNFKTALAYGDLSYSPLEQLSALVDEVTCFANLASSHFTFPGNSRNVQVDLFHVQSYKKLSCTKYCTDKVFKLE